MDFNVLNAESSDASRRRRRRKKKKSASATTEPTTTGASTQVVSKEGRGEEADPIVSACLAKGYSREEIDRYRTEMFERGLAYDQELAVLAYIQVRKSTSSGDSQTMHTNVNGTESAEKDEQDKVQKKAEEEKKGKTSVQGSTMERLLHVLNNVDEIGAVLEGIKMWYQNAAKKERDALLEGSILQLLFEKIFEKVSSMATVSSAVVTSLERQIVDVIRLLLKTGQKELQTLSKAVNSLVGSMLKIRDINAKNVELGLAKIPVQPIAHAAAWAIREVHDHASKFLEKEEEGQPSDNPAAVRSPEDVRDLNQGIEMAVQLEKTLAPVVPRGDTLNVNKSGKMSAGDVARLFRLRDTGRKLVDVSSRCLELSSTAPSQARPSAQPLTEKRQPASGVIETLMTSARERIQSLREYAAKAKQDLDNSLSSPSSTEPVLERIGVLRSELGELKDQRLQLMAQLEKIDHAIVMRSEEMRRLETSLNSTQSEMQQVSDRLREAATQSFASIAVEEMKLAALASTKHFYELVKESANIYQQAPKPSRTEDPSKGVLAPFFPHNPIAEWRTRTLLSVERYLGVEASCVGLLEQRIQDAKSKSVELEGKIANLSTLNMPTLVEEAKARMVQEKQNAVEDEQALVALRKSAQQVLDKAVVIYRQCQSDRLFSFHPQLIAALHRCADHAAKIKVSNPFASERLPELVQEKTTTPSPASMPSRSVAPLPPSQLTQPPLAQPKPRAPPRGWGVVKAPPAAPSLLEIQQEEERKEQQKQQAKETEKEPVTAEKQAELQDIEKVDASKEDQVNGAHQVNKEEEEDNDVEEDEDEEDADPAKEEQQPEEAVDPEFAVYDDDPALGQQCPSLEGLEFFNGEAVQVGTGKVTVITFYSKLNKSDFCTLSLLNRIRNTYERSDVEFVAISRDSDSKPDAFLEKYQGKYMAESPAPNNDEGLKTVRIDFPLAFDAESSFNVALKSAMRRATAGVGLTIIVDRKGLIRWYEHFVRGLNPAGQFASQLERIVLGKPLLSNGAAPQEEEEELEDGDVAAIPDDVDVFAGGGSY